MFSPKFKAGAALAIAALFALMTVAVGPAAAADVELVNKTVDVDENTESVYAEINNTDSSDATYNVTFEGLDSDGETVYTDERASETTLAGETDLVKRTSVNATTTDSVRVTVTLDDSTAAESNVHVSTGTIQKVASGSGGLLGGGSTVPIVLVVGLAGAGYLYSQRDE